MKYALEHHYGPHWILREGQHEIVLKLPTEITTCLWRAVGRNHIGRVMVTGVGNEGTVTQSLFDVDKDYEPLLDPVFEFDSRHDRITLAGFLKVLADPNYRRHDKPHPIPLSKRPTSKKAVQNDWQYSTPLQASA